jgi:hypothetical protein
VIPPKPRLRPQERDWLARAFKVFTERRAYRTLPPTERKQVVSDVWDGWAKREEIKPLVKKGIVMEFPLGREAGPLSAVTWGLTDYGLALFDHWVTGVRS